MRTGAGKAVTLIAAFPFLVGHRVGKRPKRSLFRVNRAILTSKLHYLGDGIAPLFSIWLPLESKRGTLRKREGL